MSTGFIYVVTTVNPRYEQKHFYSVPTEGAIRLYFGPCKRLMRPRMHPGDYVFGVSPSTTAQRRIVFIAKIAERITFAEAYGRFPKLHGPLGPIHVRPLKVKRNGSFPRSDYAHIKGSMHGGKPDHAKKRGGREEWEGDLASPKLDAFFVCAPAAGCVGRWLGERGPAVNERILDFLRTCAVYGVSVHGNAKNRDATLKCPIVHRGLCKGLHLETDEPDLLLKLCRARMEADGRALKAAPHVPRLEAATPKCITCPKASVCGPTTNRPSRVVGTNRVATCR